MLKKIAKSIVPGFVWNRMLRAKNNVRDRFRDAFQQRVKKLAESAGYIVARAADYYSPLNSTAALRRNMPRWNRPSRMKGIDYDVEKMKRDFAELASRYLAEFSALPPYKTLQQAGFGPGYTAVDAFTLYASVRKLKPRRYIEVGSGLSTYYCSLAAARNAEEGHPVEMTCIEPYPYPRLSTIPGIQLLVNEVQDVELSVFRQLEDGDLFFIDSSHALKVDSDVTFLFLEVLPELNPGVHIHVHDVPFPYNIPFPPEHWIFGQEWPMLWNEAMVLQAFLCFNKQFQITMATPIIRHSDENFLRELLPFYETIAQNPNTFSSVWMRRIS